VSSCARCSFDPCSCLRELRDDEATPPARVLRPLAQLAQLVPPAVDQQHPDPNLVLDDFTSAIAAWLEDLAADRGALVVHLRKLPTSNPSTIEAIEEERRTYLRLARKVRARDWIRQLRPNGARSTL
jgi:hypothetical protein